MKKLNFKWLVVLCMTMGFATVAKAQIYSSEACFYSKSGSNSAIFVVRFDGSRGQAWFNTERTSHYVREKLAESEDYYENQTWNTNNAHCYEYDSEKSTSAREVYRKKRTRQEYPMYGGVPMYGMTPTTVLEGYDYVAFSTDKSSIIKWYESKNNYDGSTGTKTYYSRIPKEDLLPKSANYDFLND